MADSTKNCRSAQPRKMQTTLTTTDINVILNYIVHAVRNNYKYFYKWTVHQQLIATEAWSPALS